MFPHLVLALSHILEAFMNWLLILKRFLAFLALVIWMAVLFSVGSTYLGPKMAGSLSPAETNFAGIVLLIVCTVDTLLLGAFILLARIYGWRLLVITMLLYYGVKTFQANIEAVYFMLNITPDLVPKLFTMTLPVTLFWPPLAVWLLGKARKPATALVETSSLPQTSAGTWVWKFALIGIVVYPLLFFSFGYFLIYRFIFRFQCLLQYSYAFIRRYGILKFIVFIHR